MQEFDSKKIGRAAGRAVETGVTRLLDLANLCGEKAEEIFSEIKSKGLKGYFTRKMSGGQPPPPLSAGRAAGPETQAQAAAPAPVATGSQGGNTEPAAGGEPPKDNDPAAADGKKKCPFCGELIRQDAVKCRFCGKFLEKTAPRR